MPGITIFDRTGVLVKLPDQFSFLAGITLIDQPSRLQEKNHIGGEQRYRVKMKILTPGKENVDGYKEKDWQKKELRNSESGKFIV